MSFGKVFHGVFVLAIVATIGVGLTEKTYLQSSPHWRAIVDCVGANAKLALRFLPTHSCNVGVR